MYQDALNKSGYNYKLPYKETITPDAPQASRRNCQRNITFDPPYRENVEMKVQKCFLSNQTFPKSNPFQKIFIQNTYRCYRSPPRVKISMHQSLRHLSKNGIETTHALSEFSGIEMQLNCKQWGCCSKGLSTVGMLMSMSEKWKKAVDNCTSVGVVFIDFQKAFDTVPHDII